MKVRPVYLGRKSIWGRHAIASEIGCNSHRALHRMQPTALSGRRRAAIKNLKVCGINLQRAAKLGQRSMRVPAACRDWPTPATGWPLRPRESVRRLPNREAWPREKPQGTKRGRSAKSVCSRLAACSGIAARPGAVASDSRGRNGQPVALNDSVQQRRKRAAPPLPKGFSGPPWFALVRLKPDTTHWLPSSVPFTPQR